MDNDAIVRARVALLDVYRMSLAQQVAAHRILAEVSPAVHLPKLSRALARFSYEAEARNLPEARLLLLDEAVAAAEAMAADDPRGPETLLDALDTRQRLLFEMGRRGDGLVDRSRMAAIERAEPGTRRGFVRGLEAWAAGLAEERRHTEAADVYAEAVRADRADSTDWSRIAWHAQLIAAGRHDEAVAVAAELVDRARKPSTPGQERRPHVFHALLHLARTLDRAGRDTEADRVRAEADTLLGGLAADQPSESASATDVGLLLSVDTAADECAAEAGPVPAFGNLLYRWSADVRQRFEERTAELGREVDALPPVTAADPTAELVALHRRRVVRQAVLEAERRYRFVEHLQPLFDRGVALARALHAHHPGQGAGPLATALTDRALLWTVAGHYAAALADFRQAQAVSG
ncbi:hypothetical protein [Kitasatospora sp. KL5]|uniref:hypothetical protein n=1 Tax=Kitasatospora sp. KL5 TaxID=3425125 RepID=UPI003D6FB199